MAEPKPPINDPLEWEITPGGPTVAQFLTELSAPTEGWSEAYGGIDGVIAAAALAQSAILELSNRAATVRTAAIRQQLRCESGAAIGRRHGISGAAISQSATSTRIWKDERW